MDENLRHQRDTSLGQLEALMGRGRKIRNARSVDATRAWHQDCAAAINQLSGGSKAHWLARAYSGAFMVRSADGAVVVEVDATEIVDRILDVLTQGAASLSSMDQVEAASSGATPRPRRFEFVHRPELRPVCEQAFDDSRDALARHEWALALILSCGLIDALLTDALEADARLKPSRCDAGDGLRRATALERFSHRCSADLQVRPDGRPEGLHYVQSENAVAEPNDSLIAASTFEQRIAEAERAGLIRGGCARLPPVARTYRDLSDANGELRPDASVSERDARLAGQVLHVVMRDLDPGR